MDEILPLLVFLCGRPNSIPRRGLKTPFTCRHRRPGSSLQGERGLIAADGGGEVNLVALHRFPRKGVD